MKITGVEAWLVSMRLSRPYTAAYDRVETTDNVFLRILTDRRYVGYGCAAPDEHDTGETAHTILDTIRTIVAPALKGADPLRSALLMEQLRPVLKDEPSICAAVEMALMDILGKKCEAPLWKILGGYRAGSHQRRWDPPDADRRPGATGSNGFTVLKLKGRLDVETDIARSSKSGSRGTPLPLDSAPAKVTVEQALWFIERTRHSLEYRTAELRHLTCWGR